MLYILFTTAFYNPQISDNVKGFLTYEALFILLDEFRAYLVGPFKPALPLPFLKFLLAL